jgi:predicted AlkP superfamily phosphohydrolase/phosphomutase
MIRILLLSAYTALGVLCIATPALGKPRVLVLGMDGLDPDLLARYLAEDKLPNFQRLAAQGEMQPLATSMPPQSPVAWSSVIAGCHPGTHQIFDFIHRDPNPREPGLPIRPYLSTSTVEPPASERQIALGRWRIPLSAERVKLERRGPTFWDFLVKQGIDTAIYRIPANYPAQEVDGQGHFQCLTGMGTPDLVGSYGEFTLFTPDAPPRGRKVSGGRYARLEMQQNRALGQLLGPKNHLRQADARGRVPDLHVRFEAVRDPVRDLVKLTLGDHAELLKTGEWSRWIPFQFETGIPGSRALRLLRAPTALPGMVRFYVKQVHPHLVLFATPVNIDPTRPVNPISVPASFSRELAEATGLYYTAGIPQHTPEIQRGALDEDQWLEKTQMILAERRGQFRYALRHFRSGCLFFYFGDPDLVSHIFWRDQDPQHPGRDPGHADRYAHVIEHTYIRMDQLVGEALACIQPGDTLIVMSDHGFCSFRRGFNLNTWLLQNGYITLRDPSRRGGETLLTNVDWSRTRAYGLGLNGLYVNLRGREKYGSVPDGAEKRGLLQEIAEKMLEVRDEDGSQVVARMYFVADEYPNADPRIAPDLLVGYARNYRAGWATLLGGMPHALIEDNHDRWSGDHCVAAHLVPGILVSNRRITVDDPKLEDLGPTILDRFGLEIPTEMMGRAILEKD